MISRGGLVTARISNNLCSIGTQFVCLLSAALFALSGCATIRVGTGNETEVRVVDLKIGMSPIGWKDDETIVVIGDAGERYARTDGAIETVLRVMTINYKTGRREVFSKVGGEFCFSDGYGMYVFPDRATNELWVSYGELGKEATRKINPGELQFDRGPISSCRPRQERPPKPKWLPDNTRFWNLWPHEGLVNCGSAEVSVRTRHVKARFHKADDEIGVELPFSCYEVFRGLKYYAFKGAYFALEFDFRSPWPEGRDRKAFWIYPDGRVQTVTLPYSYAIREHAIPTIKGIVTFARPVKRGDEYSVHLITPAGADRIMRGNASGIPSPDGCRVAMLHDPDFDARVNDRSVGRPGTLKVLELCSSGK